MSSQSVKDRLKLAAEISKLAEDALAEIERLEAIIQGLYDDEAGASL
jgi:hypothetical protein